MSALALEDKKLIISFFFISVYFLDSHKNTGVAVLENAGLKLQLKLAIKVDQINLFGILDANYDIKMPIGFK